MLVPGWLSAASDCLFDNRSTVIRDPWSACKSEQRFFGSVEEAGYFFYTV